MVTATAQIVRITDRSKQAGTAVGEALDQIKVEARKRSFPLSLSLSLDLILLDTRPRAGRLHKLLARIVERAPSASLGRQDKQLLGIQILAVHRS